MKPAETEGTENKSIMMPLLTNEHGFWHFLAGLSMGTSLCDSFSVKHAGLALAGGAVLAVGRKLPHSTAAPLSAFCMVHGSDLGEREPTGPVTENVGGHAGGSRALRKKGKMMVRCAKGEVAGWDYTWAGRK